MYVGGVKGQRVEHLDLQVLPGVGAVSLCVYSLQRVQPGPASTVVPVRPACGPSIVHLGEGAGLRQDRGPCDSGSAVVIKSEYVECGEPFCLLKAHTCKVVEKVRRERVAVEKELEEQLTEAMKRTNSIYNTAIHNEELEDIPCIPRGKRCFERFAKIRLPMGEGPSGRFVLSGGEGFSLL